MTVLKQIFTSLLNERPDKLTGLDGYTFSTSAADYEYQVLLNQYLDEVEHSYGRWRNLGQALPTQTKIMETEPEFQAALIVALVRRVGTLRSSYWRYTFAYRNLYNTLMRRKLSFTHEQLVEILKITGRIGHFRRWYSRPHLLTQITRMVAEQGLTSEMSVALSAYKRGLDERLANDRKLIGRINTILGIVSENIIERSEPWADALLCDLEAMPSEQRIAWQQLLEQVIQHNGARPSQRWLQSAQSRLDTLGVDTFITQLLVWFPQVRGKAEARIPQQASTLLKGLVWTGSLVEDKRLAAVIADLGIACFTKIPGVGGRAVAVGNACIYTLGAMPGIESIAGLARLRQRVKYKQAQDLIQIALQSVAAAAGLSVADLEELAVPDMGLEPGGMLHQRFGEYTAELRIVSTSRVEVRWLHTDGKAQKSVPTAVSRAYATEVKQLKRKVSAIQKMLPGQRDRIEQFLLTQRSWRFQDWKTHYIDHPLVGALGRRLIWYFESGARSVLGIWHAGELVDEHDQPIDWPDAETNVRLWHPLGFEPGTVQAWRAWLDAHQVSQPFKQAHREVYLLTDAELDTNTYSNRFAAHILRQHQMAALCRQRGWSYRLQGWWDDANWPSLELAGWDLQVEFAVEAIVENEAVMTAAGASLYVTTDQVRFMRQRAAVPLTEVPALVLSEVLRDIDLFVGVCSVGNDPNWRDRGELPNRYAGYWQSYSFGALSVSAETRRQVLESLLPRLKIRDRCTLEERFLRVQGHLRTYKIHLGSGNILMSPNDQYLCIVADRSTAFKKGAQFFLPFEGDQMLSVILSKAFLLAEDHKIKDLTIIRQIKRTL